MALKICELTSIILSTLVTGMFFGPRAALSRSINAFNQEMFLAILHRMTRNMAPVMTVLMPAALLSLLLVLFASYKQQPRTFYLTPTDFALFLVALLVTTLIEVPMVSV